MSSIDKEHIYVFIYLLLFWVASYFIVKWVGVFEPYGGGGYDDIARNILKDGEYPTSGVRPPLYPYVLSLLMYLFGDFWRESAHMLNIILSGFISVLIFRISYEISHSKYVSFTSVLIFSLNPMFLWESVQARETVLFSFLCISILYIFFTNIKSTSKYTLIGSLASLAYLTRPTGIIMVFLFIIFVVYRKGLLSREFIVGISAVLIIALPWKVFLYSNIGYKGLSSSTTGGLNLYKGNNPMAVSTYPWVEVDKQTKYIRRSMNKKAPVNANSYLRKKALKFMINNPIKFIDLSTRKFVSFYSPLHYPSLNADIHKVNGTYYIEKGKSKPPIKMFIPVWYFTPILICFIVFVSKYSFYYAKNVKNTRPIMAFIVLLTILHTITFFESRMRVPIEPILCVFSSLVIIDSFEDIEW